MQLLPILIFTFFCTTITFAIIAATLNEIHCFNAAAKAYHSALGVE